MRIIERGVPPETKEIEVTCRNCKTVFAFLPIEARRVNDQRDGDFWSLPCPICTKQVTKAVRP